MTKTTAKQLACRTVAQLIRGYVQQDSWCIAAHDGGWGSLSEDDFIRFTDAFKELEAEMWRRSKGVETKTRTVGGPQLGG